MSIRIDAFRRDRGRLTWLGVTKRDRRLRRRHGLAAAGELFAGLPQVTVIAGDWAQLYLHGPFDLLVLDGGAHGPPGPVAVDPDLLLRPGGTVVIDDLTPARHWPPRYAGGVDEDRLGWLDYPGLDAAELRLAPDLAALVVTRRHLASG